MQLELSSVDAGTAALDAGLCSTNCMLVLALISCVQEGSYDLISPIPHFITATEPRRSEIAIITLPWLQSCQHDPAARRA